jgi:hypothetical protein
MAADGFVERLEIFPNGKQDVDAVLKVRIHLPPAESHQQTELSEFRPREGGFPMVSSRSFGNDHLIDRLAAGLLVSRAGRISRVLKPASAR